MSAEKYTVAMLADAVSKTVTFKGVLEVLGIRHSAGMQSHLTRRIRVAGIATSHFIGKAHRRGKHSAHRLRPEQLLVHHQNRVYRVAGSKLKRALLEVGRVYTCGECGRGPEWNGKPLALEVDHINGNWADCRADNLRFVCPNCHSQFPTSRGRPKRADSPTKSLGRGQYPESVPTPLASTMVSAAAR